MCNQLHPESKPIPKEGVGWKIFDKNLTPVFNDAIAYQTKDKNGWVKWWRNDQIKHGFCFFLTKEVAERCLPMIPDNADCRIYKIKYKEGLGKHIERGFFSNRGTVIGLCKKFKIIFEDKNV